MPDVACVQSRANVDEKKRIKDRMLAGSHLLKEDSGLELWSTPKGDYWIPKGNRYVLPFNLAEMEQHIYGQRRAFHPCRRRGAGLRRQRRRFHPRGAGGRSADGGSVEISPSSAECIRRNLAAEVRAGRVIVYPKGVWDKDDTLILNVDEPTSRPTAW